MKSDIDWTVFKGSSHCEEGLAEFAMGVIKTFKSFEEYFLPSMKSQAEEVRKMKNSHLGIDVYRRRARRAFKRFRGVSVGEGYE